MAIPVYQPQLSVQLIKVVDRKDGVSDRYTKAARDIDITPYLGEAGAVRTVKGVCEPAGAFSLSFADQSRDGLDTLYAMIEPMDMVEIRAARTPPKDGKLPLIMRGFVNSVRRCETIGDDGTPQRVVVVQGQDAGLLLQVNHVFFEMAWLRDKPYLEQFALQAVTGMEARPMGIAEFIAALVTEVVNPKVERLFAVKGGMARPFSLRATVQEGSVSPGMVAPMQGSLWTLMDTYADRPWNELFVEDEEGGPVVVFRPAPYLGLDGTLLTIGGKPIMPGMEAPERITLTDADVVSLDVSRSNARTANWFWSPATHTSLATNGWVGLQAMDSNATLYLEHGNCREDLYGLRKMELASRLFPDVPQTPAQAAPDRQEAVGNQYVDWHVRRARQLAAMNQDNVAFEEGAATVIGREDLKAGRTLRLERGSTVAEHYITRVGHSIRPLSTWTSLLTLERGTGFVERAKATDNPYFAEGRKGPYSA